MESPALTLYTIAQLANSLGVSNEAIRQRLSETPANNEVLIRGQKAKAWYWAELPPALCAEIAKAARERGFSDPEHMLRDGFGPWQPPLPWDQVLAQFRREAELLRDVFAPHLLRVDLTRQEKLEAISDDYYRATRSRRTSESVSKIADLAETRDRGFKDFRRAELYAPDAAFQPAPAPKTTPRQQTVHHELDDVFESIGWPKVPDAGERELIFTEACRHLKKLLDSKAGRFAGREIKASLLDYLMKVCGGLSKSSKALRRVFNLNFQTFLKTGQARSDSRIAKSGNWRTPDFSPDYQKLKEFSHEHDTNVTLAYRKLRQAGELSKEYVGYHKFNARENKSYVPNSTRRRVTPDVKSAQPYRSGEKAVRLASPYISRKWGNVQPGDWIVFDDVSWNDYFTQRRPDGKRMLVRPECLIGCDERTDFLTPFILKGCPWDGGKASYNMADITDLMIISEEAMGGLPRCGYTLENGAWRGRCVPGQVRKRDALKWGSIQRSLLESEYQIHIERHHATSPRAKIIEGVFRILQERQRNHPNFVGFNERNDKREEVQALIRRARAGDEDALDCFFSMEEMKNALVQCMEEFVSDPQNGKRNPGCSPREAWEATIKDLPLRKLTPEALTIFANCWREVPNGEQGIVLRMPGLGKVCYFNAQLGELRSKGETRVIVHFNTTRPEWITVLTKNRQTRFRVQGAIADAKTATKEDFERINRRKKAFMAPVARVVGGIKNRVISSMTRDDEISDRAKDLGRFIIDSEQAEKELASSQDRKLRQAETMAARSGLSIPPEATTDPDRLQEALDLEREAREELAREKGLQ